MGLTGTTSDLAGATLDLAGATLDLADATIYLPAFTKRIILVSSPAMPALIV